MDCTTTANASVSRVSGRQGLAYAPAMSERLDDSALMLRYRDDGNTAAFEILYRRHNDSLYRYLLRLSRSPEVAEDLFQEAWSKVIRARSRYRPTARFSTYLFRVAHNCFIDHLRRDRRHQALPGADPEQVMADGDRPEDAAESLRARERLEVALAGLPPEQRDAFLLREEGGLSLEDIALVTGVNRETAKSRLRYAVAKLRAAIAGDDTFPAESGHG